MDAPQFQARLKELRKSYEAKLPEKLAHIKGEWQNYIKGGESAHQHLLMMQLLVHRLSGSGATFGYQWVSEIAERIELLLKLLIEKREQPSLTQKEQIQTQLITLDAMKTYAPSMNKGRTREDTKIRDVPETDSVAGKKLLFMVEDDEEYALLLTAKLDQFGFMIRHFKNGEFFEKALIKQKPVAILMDMDLPEGVYGGAEVIRRVNNGESKPIPVIFISLHKSFESRLQAVRAGATHYFVKPFEVESLVNAIAEISGGLPSVPYRVLIVDDDEELTEMYRMSLEADGFQVNVVNDSLGAMAVLEEFEPDLILMDVLMPGCNGIELATIIRQSREYDLTPIIFMTTEWRNDVKLVSMNLGSDDFLAKPIAPWSLVANLRGRIKRARTLRAGTTKNRDLMHELGKLSYAIDQHSIVSKTDVSGTIIHVNDKFCEISGYSREELLGQNHRLIKSSFHPPEMYVELWGDITSGKVWQGDLKNRNKNGEYYWASTTIVPILDDFGMPYQYISIRTETTKGREQNQNNQSA